MEKLNGLVLCGGESKRMKTPKGRLNYHGNPQQVWAYELMKEVCNDVFLSVKNTTENQENLPFLPDVMDDAGPVGGLLAAHKHSPAAAWVVIGCDYPWLTLDSIQKLVEERKSEKLATAFQKEPGFPEPLLAIWEPAGLEKLEIAVKNGQLSPRKMLLENSVYLVDPLQPIELQSVDTPEQFAAALEKLKEGE